MSESERHRIERVRREPRRRELVVEEILDLSRSMRRIVFRSDDLHDFESLGPDDHIKLFLPGEGSADGKPLMRDFTPRRFDTAAGVFELEFFLHDAGPATEWARQAGVGDRISIGGPRGSMVVADDFDWYLLAGDETALPAIARRMEKLRDGVPVHCILLVEAPEDSFDMPQRDGAHVQWIYRAGRVGEDADLIGTAISTWELPEGDGFAFVAAEARASQGAREILAAKGQKEQWIKAAGYWSALAP